MNLKKEADTSISVANADKFNRNEKAGKELHCQKNSGFFLLKQVKKCSWRLRYTDAEGKRRKATLGKYPGMVPREAAFIARELTSGLKNEGKDPLVIKEQRKEETRRLKKQTLRAFLDGTYTLHQSRKKDAGKPTINIIRSNFEDWLNRPMESLTKQDAHDWQLRREQKVKRPTIVRAYGALKTMLNYAANEGYISANPLDKVSLLNQSAADYEEDDNSKRRILTPDELAGLGVGLDKFEETIRQQRRNSRRHGKPHLSDLDEVAFAHWFVPYFHCALHLGMRPGDIRTLRWEHVNLTFKRVVKILEKTRHHNEPAKIDLPLNDTILDVLIRWNEQQGKPQTGLVFPSPVTGTQLDRLAHSKSWENLKKSAGDKIPVDLQFYSLRHHFISQLVSNGVPLFVVAKLAGHKGTKMIEQHYGHLAPSDAAAAMQAYEKTLSEGHQKQSPREERGAK